MSDTDQRIESAVQMLERDTQLTHDITHGDETSVVQTEGGPVPSHKKVATDGYQYFVNELRPRVADINQHAKLVTDSASEANTARNEAVKAKNDAVAIVHNDEGSLTPKPGAYAVADSNGHYDIGWTPHLAALYPYSGVMGSVNKNNIFFCSAIPGWENRFRFANTRPKFNIAGKIVNIGYPVYIDLPEAERTPDRSIAFDDVFLDWGGNITTFRSITPHRTTTGYDRDAIASEHGYSKAGNALYKKGDSYSLLLCRVARRNSGAYHPVFNPEGTTGFYRERDPNESLRKNTSAWYYTEILKENIIKEDCFDPAHHPGGVGNIANQNSALKLRPNKEEYDAIFADDITPLYLSAEKVQDRQALLFDSFNRALAGETFMGAEGTQGYKLTGNNLLAINDDLKGTPLSLSYSGLKSEDAPNFLGKHIIIENINDKKLFLCKINDFYTSEGGVIQGFKVLHYDGKRINELDDWDNKNYTVAWASTAKSNIWYPKLYPLNKDTSARSQFMAIDVIGSLDAMPDEWKTKGIPGNWLAVGEEGESLIPDGKEKSYKLSRKCIECYIILKTSDNGKKWSDWTVSGKSNAEGTGNTLGVQSFSDDELFIVFYLTSANPFILSSNASVVEKSSECTWSDIHEFNGGSVFISNILDKVGRGSVTDTSTILNNPLRFGKYSTYHKSYPEHKSLRRISNSQVAAVKSLPYLSVNKSLINLQCIYKEIKGNGTNNGDDNKFNIIDYQSTVTDNNGEQVIVGQKRVELPYQFDGVTL